MVNPDSVKQFGAKLLSIYTGGVLTNLIDIGYQTGLFEASNRGAATSAELSERAGVRERGLRFERRGLDQRRVVPRQRRACVHDVRATW